MRPTLARGEKMTSLFHSHHERRAPPLMEKRPMLLLNLYVSCMYALMWLLVYEVCDVRL